MSPQALRVRRLAQILNERADVDSLGAIPMDQPVMQKPEPPKQIERVTSKRECTAIRRCKLAKV